MHLWMGLLGLVDNGVSEGPFFGGHPKVADWREKCYYAYLDHYLAQHVFVGKDQTLINALFLLRPSHIISVWHGDPDAPAALFRPATFSSLNTDFILSDCSDQLYYHKIFLASDEERDKMREVRDRTWYWDVLKKRWWTRRELCWLTGTVDMLTSLRRTTYVCGWVEVSVV